MQDLQFLSLVGHSVFDWVSVWLSFCILSYMYTCVCVCVCVRVCVWLWLMCVCVTCISCIIVLYVTVDVCVLLTFNVFYTVILAPCPYTLCIYIIICVWTTNCECGTVRFFVLVCIVNEHTTTTTLNNFKTFYAVFSIIESTNQQTRGSHCARTMDTTHWTGTQQRPESPTITPPGMR